MNSTELYLTACRKKGICVLWPCQFSMSSQTRNLQFTTCFKIQNSAIQDPIVVTTQLTKSLSLSLIHNNIIAVPLFTQFPYLHHCCFQPSPFIFNNQQQINNIQIQNKLMNLTIAFSTNSNFHTILTYSAFTQSFHDHKLTH